MSFKVRIIPCLDVKDGRVVKGVNFVDLRDAGDPVEAAIAYDAAGADELTFLDITASHENRGTMLDVVRRTAEACFMPVTVGGGVRTVEDIRVLLQSGADKVSINTAAIRRPEIITEVARRYGSQAMVLSVEAKRLRGQDKWEAYVDNGREKTGRDVVEWVRHAVSLGAGEILLTSVDHEGMAKGFDIPLCRAVTAVVDVPVILSGGMGTPAHALAAIEDGHADALAMAHVLHYNKLTVDAIRDYLTQHGVEVCRHDESVPA